MFGLIGSTGFVSVGNSVVGFPSFNTNKGRLTLRMFRVGLLVQGFKMSLLKLFAVGVVHMKENARTEHELYHQYKGQA